MATIRATVNNFGFYVLDVKFDMVNTGNAFDMIDMCLKATVKEYNPAGWFWKIFESDNFVRFFDDFTIE